MSLSGSGSTFLPYTLNGLSDATFSNSNIGNGIATTFQLTTATPNKIARFDTNQYLVSATVDTTDIVPYAGATTTINLNSQNITTTRVPVGVSDLTNKTYVDSAISASSILATNNTFTGTNTFNNTLTTGVGYTSNLNSIIKTVQTPSGQSAGNFTTVGLPSGVPAGSVLSGSYTLTAGVSSGAMGMWLGAYAYTNSQNSFTFTGMSGSQTLALYVYQYNTAGTLAVQISDSVYTITTSSATVSGSFLANKFSAYSGKIVFYFQASAVNQSVSFSGFFHDIGSANVNGSLSITGVATETPITTIGLNASNQLIKYTNPVSSVFTGSVSSTYIPYASSANVLANSNISQTATGDIFVNGFMGVGASVPLATLHVQGSGLVCGGTNYANTNNRMALGSLTLGAINKNYGGGSGWNGNTAGLLMECQDSTEIAIHDSNDTVASLMYYTGNQFTIGRNMGFGGGVSPVNFAARVQITQTNGNLIQLGNNSSGVLYWTNPNGLNTHFGYPSGGGSDNYIRGTYTYIDTATQISGGLSVPSGIIECANQPFCIVGCIGGASIGYGVGQVIGAFGFMYAYSSASMNNLGTSGWNSPFGRFYFTKSGRWQVNWSFYWNNFAAGSRVVLNRYNSASVIQESRYCALNGGGIGGDSTQAYSTLFYVNAGDFTECSFSTGGGTIYFGGITHTHCTYHFVG